MSSRFTDTEKKCGRCNEWLPHDAFARNRRHKSGLQDWCRACRSTYLRAKWRADEDFRQRHLAAVRRNYADKWEMVRALKVERGCARCGCRDNPDLLQWDHIDPRTKWTQQSPGVYGPGTLAAAFLPGWSMERILQEIEKCQVLCRPCHNKKTSEDAKRYGKLWRVYAQED